MAFVEKALVHQLVSFSRPDSCIREQALRRDPDGIIQAEIVDLLHEETYIKDQLEIFFDGHLDIWHKSVDLLADNLDTVFISTLLQTKHIDEHVSQLASSDKSLPSSKVRENLLIGDEQVEVGYLDSFNCLK